MGAQWNQVLIHYVDAAGKQATTYWSLQDQGDAVPAGLVALANAVQACSNAHVAAVQLQTTHPISGSAIAAPYQSVQDVVHMTGRYGLRTANYDIIAPKQDILLADNVTLDIADPAVSALAVAMTGVLGTPAGSPLTSIIKGVRQWSGRR